MVWHLEATPVSKNFNWIRGDTFTARIEYNAEYAIIHIPSVEHMDRKALREMTECLQDAWDFFHTVGYPALFAAIPKEDEATNKLARLLKFSFMSESEEFNVYKFEGE